MKLSLHTVREQAAPWVWWLTGLLVLAPLGGHAAGMVLCIEPDGTVTVEQAVGFSCGSSENPFTLEDPSHCDSCIDVVLPGKADEDCASFIVKPAPSAQVDLPVVTYGVPFSNAEVSLLRRDPEDDLASSSSTLTPLRSVVLLI